MSDREEDAYWLWETGTRDYDEIARRVGVQSKTVQKWATYWNRDRREQQAS